MCTASDFPRGLLQAEGSFRFSIDALLLAAFAAPQSTERSILDMGTGCGVVAFSLALQQSQAQLIGIDCEQALLDAAVYNAHALGLAERFTALCVPIQEAGLHIPQGSMDLIVANPPYFPVGSGRMPAHPLRQKALFEVSGSLNTFTAVAKALLAPKGRFCCIYPAQRLEHCVTVLAQNKLYIHRLLPVHSKADMAAQFILIEARRQRASEMRLLPALILYTGTGDNTQLRDEAIEFCPELACNR